MIAPMRILGWSIRSIAAQLGRAPSTISRELRRNCDESGAYAGYWAHREAQRRRCTVRRSCLRSGGLATYVHEKLQCRWSPEQIAHRVRLDSPHATQMRISHHTISTWLAVDHRTGGSWSRYLRHHRRRRKRYGSGPRAAHIPGRVSLADRPTIVHRRGRLGDWEGISWSVKVSAVLWPHTWIDAVAFFGHEGVTSDRCRSHGGHAKTHAAAPAADEADAHRGERE